MDCSTTIPQITQTSYETTETACPSCGSIVAHRTQQGQWGPHRLKLLCEDCGAHIRWLPVASPDKRQQAKLAGIGAWMATQQPTEKQLRYLRVLGYDSAPANRLEASQLINALLARRGGAA